MKQTITKKINLNLWQRIFAGLVIGLLCIMTLLFCTLVIYGMCKILYFMITFTF